MSPLRLPDFTMPEAEPPAPSEIEDEGTLAAYESGYAAGWEDAVAAQSEAKSERAAEVARALAAVTLSRQEARLQTLEALKPLILQMSEIMLPTVARAALAPLIAETILPLAAEATEEGPRLRIPPSMRVEVEEYLAGTACQPIDLAEDPALEEGQVRIEASATEIHIDIGKATETAVAAVKAFFETRSKERQNAG